MFIVYHIIFVLLFKHICAFMFIFAILSEQDYSQTRKIHEWSKPGPFVKLCQTRETYEAWEGQCNIGTESKTWQNGVFPKIRGKTPKMDGL